VQHQVDGDELALVGVDDYGVRIRAQLAERAGELAVAAVTPRRG
jgi:hypothetical protein